MSWCAQLNVALQRDHRPLSGQRPGRGRAYLLQQDLSSGNFAIHGRREAESLEAAEGGGITDRQLTMSFDKQGELLNLREIEQMVVIS